MKQQNQRKNNQRKKRQRGMGMVATMLVLMGLLSVTLVGVIAGGGLMGTATNSVQASSVRGQSSAAFNMAEAGVQYTLSWLNNQASPPANTSAFAPSTFWGATISGNRAVVIPDASNPGNYFSVRIYPDSYDSDVSSLTSTQKKYLIESVGVSNGRTSVVQAYVGQISLSQYLVLLNSWNNSSNFWVSGLTTFDGPVHDNNANGVAENVFWKSTSGVTPMFSYTGDDAYTVSNANGVNWWNNWNPNTAPQVVTNADGSQTNQWLNVAAGGASTVHTGAATVPFPTSSNIQKNAAIGSAASLNATGVTLCTGGGIYIEGNVDEMALSTSGANNTAQVITVTQGTTVQRVTIDPSSGTTTLEEKKGNGNGNGSWKTVSTLSGTTNGVLYVNGNVGAQGDPKTGGLHGTMADNLLDNSGNQLHNNALTIATPQTNNVNLDGSVTYNTKRQVTKDASGNPEYIDANGSATSNAANGTPVNVPESQDSAFTTKAGTLGIVTNNALVTETDSSGNSLNNFEMDGTVLASGLYDADHFDSRPVGVWENMGGYLSSTVGTFGQFNNSLLLDHGFNTQFNYDARMRNNPPPYFPTTGNQYNIISWQQVSKTLE